MEKTAAQKGIGQIFFVVRGDADQRPVPGVYGLAGFVDMAFHAVEFAKHVVGQFDIGLVDFVDQDHGGFVGLESLPQPSLDDESSEESSVGQECVSTCIYRRGPCHYKQKKK